MRLSKASAKPLSLIPPLCVRAGLAIPTEPDKESLKLERILFSHNVFDPRTSRGADNNRSFFTSSQGYDIDLDPETGIVKVSYPENGRHCCIHASHAQEWREYDAAGPTAYSLVKPKYEAVKTAEGAYKMVKLEEPVVEVEAASADPIAIPPRKRGRPRKAV